jgi:hypothetical protein
MTFFRKRPIFGCESEGTTDSVYMTRYSLVMCRLGEIAFHRFYRSDGNDMHDHPWPFVSIVLWRGYREHTPRGVKRIWPGMVLFRPARWVHRVELVGPSAWTLVIKGPRVRMWGYHTARGWQMFRDYWKEHGC